MGARLSALARLADGDADVGRPARARAASRMWPNRKKKPQLGCVGACVERER
jgi:hypothetical protein